MTQLPHVNLKYLIVYTISTTVIAVASKCYMKWHEAKTIKGKNGIKTNTTA